MSQPDNPSPTDVVLEKLRSLKIEVDQSIPYRLTSVFAQTNGWGANGEIKRRAKLLNLVGPTLHEILLPKEEVLYVAKGVQYSFVESYFMGAWLAALVNQTVFVLTNLRLLMMRSNRNGKPLETFWVIYYSEIARFKPSWTGVLQLKLEDRKLLTFTGFSSLDRKAMPKIFQDAIEQYERLGFEPDVTQSRENLCSYCFRVVPQGDYDCAHCGAEYWKPRDLALRSLVFPSWGDLCMKHYGVATMELFGYCISWVAAANALRGPQMLDGLIIVLLIFSIEHPFDSFLTYNVAKKGLNPRHPPDPERTLGIDRVEDFSDDAIEVG